MRNGAVRRISLPEMGKGRASSILAGAYVPGGKAEGAVWTENWRFAVRVTAVSKGATIDDGFERKKKKKDGPNGGAGDEEDEDEDEFEGDSSD
jgi:hypothetical protein